MYLQWKKSGRSVCGKYQASKAGAYYIETATTLAYAAESAAANRAICQRHAWKIAAQQAINRVCLELVAPDESGASILSHALKVDSSQVSRWKLGRVLVPPAQVARIAKLCQLNPESLRPDLEFFTDTSGQVTWQKRSLIVGGAES